MTYTRVSSKSPVHKDLMNCMSGLNKQMNFDEPDCYAGPFWYSAVDKKCYGVRKSLVNDCSSFTGSDGSHYKTSKILHKDIWKNLRTKYPTEPKYRADYTKFPRGRVFWFENAGMVVFTGDWIRKTPDAKQAIIDEFELPSDTKFIEDEHWDIGRGDSIDFLQ